MKIQTYSAKIKKIEEISPTVREVTFELDKEIEFKPGSFVNVFVPFEGQEVRRAYSICSDSKNKKEVSISLRNMRFGKISPLFWEKEIQEKEFKIVGPLGINTSDKITKNKVFLFSFGVGVSVIKGLLFDLLNRETVDSITLFTGNRDEKENLYKEYFEELAQKNKKLKFVSVLSQPNDLSFKNKGYIQDFIGDEDFNNSDIYVCGPTKACDSLVETINIKKPTDCLVMSEKFG